MLSQVIEVNNWGNFLLKQLFTFYVNNEHCDLILMCNKQQFSVHRAVMSASSEYFRNIKKDTEMIILPNEVSCTALKQLIGFMYTGELEVNENTKKSLISLLHLIKIPMLLDLIKGTNEGDCIDVTHWNNLNSCIEEISAKKPKIRGRPRKSILKLKKMNGLSELLKFPVTGIFNYDVYKNVRMEDISRPLRFEATNKTMFYYSNFDNISYESDPILKQIEAYNINNTSTCMKDNDQDDDDDDDDNDINGGDYKSNTILSQEIDDECSEQKIMLIGDDTVPYIFNSSAAVDKYDHHTEWDDNEQAGYHITNGVDNNDVNFLNESSENIEEKFKTATDINISEIYESASTNADVAVECSKSVNGTNIEENCDNTDAKISNDSEDSSFITRANTEDDNESDTNTDIKMMVINESDIGANANVLENNESGTDANMDVTEINESVSNELPSTLTPCTHEGTIPNDDNNVTAADMIVKSGEANIVNETHSLNKEIQQSKTIVLNSSEIKGLANHSDLIQTVIKKLPSLTANGKRICFKIKSTTYLKNDLFANCNNNGNNNTNQKISAENITRTNKRVNNVDIKRKLSVENVKGPWGCYDCGDKSNGIPLNFSTYRSYRQHIRDVHNMYDNGQYCEYCGHKSQRKMSQYYHLYVYHNVKPPKTVYFPKCEECNFIASSKRTYETHKRQHELRKKYFCICGQRFVSNRKLSDHTLSCSRVASKKEYRCAICNISLDRMINLKAHIRINHKHLLSRLAELKEFQQGILEVNANGINVTKFST